MKNNLTLDIRLQNIANYVDKCNKVADIGTDHGLIPIYLILKGICKEVLACDVAKNPLMKAKSNIEAYHLEDKIKLCLTDGLLNLPLDIDTIIIAGMGGHLISSILQNNEYKYPNLILQANNHNDVLRKTLMELNYMIIKEKIVFCKEKYYEIIVAKKVDRRITLSDDEIKYGPINLQEKTDTFRKKYSEKLISLNKILNDNQLSKEKEIEINLEIQKLQEILKK